MDLALAIESYLLQHPRWVPVAELCEHFQIDERQLRAEGKRRPLHSPFAISSAKPGANGLKHLRHTTVRERLAYKHGVIRRHIAAARARRDYDQALSRALTGRFDPTGQGHLAV